MPRTATSTTRETSSRKTASPDAVALLKSDHRAVEELFSQFEATEASAKKKALAGRICDALRVHTRIEEEIFYPACREAGVEEDLLDEAAVEHQSASRLIDQIAAGRPADDLWEAKVSVLKEQVEHHVEEEERRGGLFTKARAAGVDLKATGDRMARRKTELESRS
jgi:hemerythrin superfamily protein